MFLLITRQGIEGNGRLNGATLACYLHGKNIYTVQILFWNDIYIVKYIITYIYNKANITEIVS